MTISSVVETGRIDGTYNISVADFETYFVGENKVLVHNCPIGDDQVNQITPDRIISGPSRRGNAPIGDDGRPIELHHTTQSPDGPIDEMTRADHGGGENFKKNHSNTGQDPSKIDRKQWNKDRKNYWEKQWDEGRFDDN